jgi:hypothetical protein
MNIPDAEWLEDCLEVALDALPDTATADQIGALISLYQEAVAGLDLRRKERNRKRKPSKKSQVINIAINLIKQRIDQGELELADINLPHGFGEELARECQLQGIDVSARYAQNILSKWSYKFHFAYHKDFRPPKTNN